jgi:hypothetical protein
MIIYLAATMASAMVAIKQRAIFVPIVIKHSVAIAVNIVVNIKIEKILSLLEYSIRCMRLKNR